MSKRSKTAKTEPVVSVAVAEVVPRQIVVRHDEICSRCGAVNSFRKSGGFRTFGTVVAASARCRKCGRIAQIRAVR
jgi:hypothetical protein